ncbi:MAG: hypothetical protein KDA41_03585, partial [Planctomycetales bacterium]|nr:hypothetical protein [Planctomycetales bacterium]
MNKRSRASRLAAALTMLSIFLSGFTAFSVATVGTPGIAAAQAAPAGGAAAAAPKKMNYLSWTFKALGWMYSIIFLALSFILVALFVMNLLTARRDNIVPVHLVEAFE